MTPRRTPGRVKRGCRSASFGWRVLALVGLLGPAGWACAPEPDARGSDTARGSAPRPADDEGLVAGSATPEDGPSGARAIPPHEFETLDGEPAVLQDLAGKVVVVNFWGTWCLPCRRELPELEQLARAYEDRPFEMLGIALESGTPDEIRDFLAIYGVEYPIWIGEMEMAASRFGAVSFPFTLLIDPEGWIRKEYVGPQTMASLAPEIDALLP